MPAPGYKRLSDEQVRKLKSIEGNGMGSGVLPKLVDDALEVLAAELPSSVVSSLNGKLDAAKLVTIDSAASAGGSASETLTFTGLAVGDTILALTPKTVGANAAALRAFGTVAANQLPVTFTADPGAGAVVRALVLKA